MSEQKHIRLELTEEQKAQIKAATGKDARTLELNAEELEDRIAPPVGGGAQFRAGHSSPRFSGPSARDPCERHQPWPYSGVPRPEDPGRCPSRLISMP
jgi:hypothetical protein